MSFRTPDPGGQRSCLLDLFKECFSVALAVHGRGRCTKRQSFGIGWELMSPATSVALDAALFPGCSFLFFPFLGGGKGGGSSYVAQAGLELLGCLCLAVGITGCTSVHALGNFSSISKSSGFSAVPETRGRQGEEL